MCKNAYMLFKKNSAQNQNSKRNKSLQINHHLNPLAPISPRPNNTNGTTSSHRNLMLIELVPILVSFWLILKTTTLVSGAKVHSTTNDVVLLGESPLLPFASPSYTHIGGDNGVTIAPTPHPLIHEDDVDANVFLLTSSILNVLYL